MRPKEAALDLGYFLLTLFLVSYGLLLVLRGYLARGFSRLPTSGTGRS
ncbi:MAG: hypothetical protein ACE5LS_05270 [Thermoplasmata archaeon]